MGGSESILGDGKEKGNSFSGEVQAKPLEKYSSIRETVANTRKKDKQKDKIASGVWGGFDRPFNAGGRCGVVER